jgi:hypothetical protein
MDYAARVSDWESFPTKLGRISRNQRISEVGWQFFFLLLDLFRLLNQLFGFAGVLGPKGKPGARRPRAARVLSSKHCSKAGASG